jgi:hypothetical protein
VIERRWFFDDKEKEATYSQKSYWHDDKRPAVVVAHMLVSSG